MKKIIREKEKTKGNEENHQRKTRKQRNRK